jgi:hypothetical protein
MKKYLFIISPLFLISCLQDLPSSSNNKLHGQDKDPQEQRVVTDEEKAKLAELYTLDIHREKDQKRILQIAEEIFTPLGDRDLAELILENGPSGEAHLNKILEYGFSEDITHVDQATFKRNQNLMIKIFDSLIKQDKVKDLDNKQLNGILSEALYFDSHIYDNTKYGFNQYKTNLATKEKVRELLKKASLSQLTQLKKLYDLALNPISTIFRHYPELALPIFNAMTEKAKKEFSQSLEDYEWDSFDQSIKTELKKYK